MKIKQIPLNMPFGDKFITDLEVQIMPFSTCCDTINTYNRILTENGSIQYEDNQNISISEYNEKTGGESEFFNEVSLVIIEDIVLDRLSLERLE